jgi:SOS-response transcriptional repressor LexA
MTKDSPSPTERKLLNIIHRYISESGELPTPGQLVDDFGEKLNYLLNVIKRLEKKRYVEKQGNLIGITKKAEKYFSGALKPIRPNNVAPTQIQVVGTVKAGKTTAEELEIDMSSTGEFILLPETKLDKNSYALKVVGKSMEHEGIFDSDFVIVEEYSGIDWPKQGDLIVAKYYPFENEKENPAEDIPESEYMDLTLKVYSEQIDSNKRVYRLGWKKNNQSNPYIILASRLIPKGKVIGIYRNLRTFKFSS